MVKKILLILVLLTGIVYGLGVLYADRRFLPNTYIDGIRLDGQGYEKEETVKANAPMLKILQKNKDTGAAISETINMATDAGYQASYKTQDLLAAQDEFKWFMFLFNKTELTGLAPQGYYSKEKLLEKIGNLYCFQEGNVTEPVDAHVELIDGKLEIVPEEDGLQMNREAAETKIMNLIAQILKGEKTDTVDLTEDYLTAAIRSDSPELLNTLAEMKKVTDKRITIKIGADNNKDLEGEELVSLLKVENNEFSVDQEKLTALVKKIYEDNYVSSYQYIDQEDLIRTLGEALLAAENRSVEVSWIDYYSSSSSTRNNRVEVSLTEQTLYYYEDDRLVFTSPIVSAAPGVTPVGEFEVTKIDGSSILSGPTWEERVEYWIGFDPTGVHKGFHDASWRSEFGGEIYKTDPSHGCINMPTDMVARLWGLVHIGTPVIIYE